MPPTAPDQPTGGRTPTRPVVLVVGPGRSGTSALATTLMKLGYEVPGPEVEPDESNPRGFGEPRWVVDFHRKQMSKRFVLNADGRPQAWDLMRAESARPKPAAQLSGWLRERIDEAAGGLVVKDPRTTWFLPLWQQVVAELGERLVFITTLRPPAEAVASAQQWYDRNARRTAATRLAGWLNVMLHTEWETRGSARAFASYHALLSDWRGELRDIDQRLTLDLTLDDSAACAAVDAEIDPDLRRVRVGLEDLPLPAALRDLAADAWSALERLRVAESPGLHAEFDQMREAYDTLYLEAEGIAQSSADAQAAAARRKAARQAKARAESPADGASPDESPAAEDDGDRSPDPA